MIFAQLIGIAKKVSKQFNSLYPNFKQESLINPEITTFITYGLGKTCYIGMELGSRYDIIKTDIRTNNTNKNSDLGSSGDSNSSSGSSGGGFR